MPTFGDMHPATSLKVAKQLRLRIIMSISRMSVSLGETEIRERLTLGVLRHSAYTSMKDLIFLCPRTLDKSTLLCHHCAYA